MWLTDFQKSKEKKKKGDWMKTFVHHFNRKLFSFKPYWMWSIVIINIINHQYLNQIKLYLYCTFPTNVT